MQTRKRPIIGPRLGWLVILIVHNREVAGRIAKWSVELMGETLTYAPRKAVKSQILADFIHEWTDT